MTTGRWNPRQTAQNHHRLLPDDRSVRGDRRRNVRDGSGTYDWLSPVIECMQEPTVSITGVQRQRMASSK
jgi:hypothetical protein